MAVCIAHYALDRLRPGLDMPRLSAFRRMLDFDMAEILFLRVFCRDIMLPSLRAHLASRPGFLHHRDIEMRFLNLATATVITSMVSH